MHEQRVIFAKIAQKKKRQEELESKIGSEEFDPTVQKQIETNQYVEHLKNNLKKIENSNKETQRLDLNIAAFQTAIDKEKANENTKRCQNLNHVKIIYNPSFANASANALFTGSSASFFCFLI